MRITKVYTRGGDKGRTSLIGGERVDKDHIRIEAYGTVDELNAIIGLVRTFNGQSGADPEHVARLERMLHRIQNDLFNLGSDLATPAEKRWEGMYLISDADVKVLEEWIDALNEDLGPLKEFILPGGGPVGAFFHQARTTCRRAERRVITLMREVEGVNDGPLRYLNRLSDYLFVAGRWAAKSLGEPEFLWERR
ncbi:MAG: cob(I)yrinic acid a,c-diamide adenosyltransferase [Alphaproteobacteria bacterium]|nr:cob(I)yrinic acid a,c-diamide adenosyltransferase [Alphaproteobacteria bacterium]